MELKWECFVNQLLGVARFESVENDTLDVWRWHEKFNLRQRSTYILFYFFIFFELKILFCLHTFVAIDIHKIETLSAGNSSIQVAAKFSLCSLSAFASNGTNKM